MTTKARRIIGQPAVYGFDVILKLTDEEIKQRDYPETIRNWGWYSAVELREAALGTLKHKQRRNILDENGTVEMQLQLSDFTDLNQPPDQFSWFIYHGDGILQVNRSPKACPFGDDLLYVPAGWGKKVISAVGDGFVSVRQWFEGNSTGIKGVKLDGTEASAIAHCAV